MKKAGLSAAIGLIVSMGAGLALAETQAASVKLGSGIEFTPSLNVDVQNDDNVTHSETDQIESVIAVINPNFQLSADDGVSAYNLTYSLTKGEYFDSEEDNYLDHYLDGEVNWELNARNRLVLAGSYLDGHEPRGTGFSQGSGNAIDEPETFKNNDIHGIYSYGAKTARGRIDLTVGAKERDYDGGDRTRTRDRDTDYAIVGFFYNAGGKTELLAEGRRREIDYTYTNPGVETLNSTETDLLVGITWEGSAKTSGTVKVGARKKKFDSAAREDSTGPRWEVGIRWLPRTYSAFDLVTERRADETNGVGNFIDVQSYSLSWTHSWMERLNTVVSYTHADNEYEGVEREEKVNSSSLMLNYQMRRWLALRAGVNLSDQDSNAVGFDYEKDLTFVGFQATL